MAVKKFKPVTAGTRHKIGGTFDEITTSVPEKSLLSVKKSSGGRNNTGKMTVRYIGGGHRTARIALIVYADGQKSYIIAPNGLQVGQTVCSGAGVAPEVGNTLFLSEIPLGTIIHNIELYPGQGAAMARSAGSYAQLLAREGKFAIIKLPSGETRMVLVTCRATIGVVSNVDHSLESSGKAGRERWLGRRPRNRGVVMNPVDHPMGGGEGRASGGHPRSRKGLLAKGYKTRNPKKTTSKFIISKKKK